MLFLHWTLTARTCFDCFLHGGVLHWFEFGVPAASLLPLRPSPRRLSAPALRPSACRCTRRREALQRWGIAIPPTSPVCRSPRFFGSTRCRLSSPLARSASATGSACVLRERSEMVFWLVVWLCSLPPKLKYKSRVFPSMLRLLLSNFDY